MKTKKHPWKNFKIIKSTTDVYDWYKKDRAVESNRNRKGMGIGRPVDSIIPIKIREHK